MNLRNKLPPKVQELAQGVFQCSLAFSLDDLSIDAFAAEGIALPANLLSAVKKRQIEYLAGRYCVRLCFEEMGLKAPPMILSHEDRSPEWLPGWTGSISHARGLATAVLARSATLAGVGIDIEHVIEKPNAQLAQHICCDHSEWKHVMDALNLPEDQALTLIFSSKESLYKTIYPRLRVFFGFHAAALRVQEDRSLKIQLIADLSDRFRRGQTWNVQYRCLENGCFETLIMDWA